MPNKKNHKKISNLLIILGIVIAAAVIIGAVLIFADHLENNYRNSYPDMQFRNGSRTRMNFSGNFTLNKTKVAETATFFQSSPTLDQINSYCTQNRIYCGYYCRTNPGDTSCTQMFNSTNFMYRNYSTMNLSGKFQGGTQ